MKSVSFEQAVADLDAVIEGAIADRAPVRILSERDGDVVLVPERVWVEVDRMIGSRSACPNG